MQRNQHSTEFKQQALSKARSRGTRTLGSVAAELNLSLGTLKGWLKRSSIEGAGLPHAATLPGDVPAGQWSPVQRLLALNESHTLSGPALHAWCREKGLFEHQLIQWRDAFCAAGQAPAVSAAEQRLANTALRELQGRHDQLQREMRRKDRALAEAAALLVLQKKFQALVLQQSEGEDK
jgi:transposase-like protein